jgi:CRP-like cAMP-binding protein
VSNQAFSLQPEEVSASVMHVQRNLMQILARKAYFMHTKLKVLASGTLREKIVRFIFWGMDAEGKLQLDYTRETWASYFSVARPSLSRELSAMQQEGIINITGKTLQVMDKNTFEAYL